ncbi:unnamed protein product [Adineta steineri]|uniref:BEN domain-containing protein n=1 Tax=Adineta steineri TaxID=433720 RepID=A0A814F8V7_9BILA|nr:unnamed protein product [Adineta steineri]
MSRPRRKRLSRPNEYREKENINNKRLKQSENTSTPLKNILNTMDNPICVVGHEEQPKISESNSNDSLSQDNKSTEKQVTDDYILSDCSNKDCEIEFLSVEDVNDTLNNLTASHVRRGEKRTTEELSNSNENEYDEMNFIQLKKKCLELERRINELEGMWMSCLPYLPMVPNFSNVVSHSSNQNYVTENSNNELIDAIETIQIEPNVLLKLKKDTCTSTARSILKFKYPSPTISYKLADMDKKLVDAIVFYSKQCHPDDKRKDSHVRKAMSNYFSLIRHNKKLKSKALNTNREEQ